MIDDPAWGPVAPGGIVVTDILTAGAVWDRFDAVISIEDVAARRRMRVEPASQTEQLVLQFDDVDEGDGKAVTEAHVLQALEFARGRHRARLLLHCYAGQARSPAIALAIIADRMGAGAERDAVRRLVTIRPISQPNLRVLLHADQLLQRKGALREAWRDHERDVAAWFAGFRAGR